MENTITQRPLQRLLRRYLLTGLLIWLPLGVTLFIVKFFASYLVGLIRLFPSAWQPSALLGHNLLGSAASAIVGILLVLVVLLLTGFIASNFLGRQMLRLGEDILEYIPLVRSIYNTVKQISDTMFSKKGKAFRKVVLVRYPQRDSWSLAFLTSDELGEVSIKAPRQLISVFIPTTPNPTSGFLILVPEEEVIELEMSVDEAFKMIVSLGVIVPPYPRPLEAKTAPGLARHKRAH
ncbi:MAG: DUF502 domain-containing protein [Gammaproteobacteria bacterium]|nr:DUF502 domain-containing protein [Gammaproteobacteria bacterium]